MTTLVVDTQPRALRAELDSRNLTVHLADGRILIVPLAWYPRLQHASPEERQTVEVFADGEEMHWPDLDDCRGGPPHSGPEKLLRVSPAWNAGSQSGDPPLLECGAGRADSVIFPPG